MCTSARNSVHQSSSKVCRAVKKIQCYSTSQYQVRYALASRGHLPVGHRGAARERALSAVRAEYQGSKCCSGYLVRGDQGSRSQSRPVLSAGRSKQAVPERRARAVDVIRSRATAVIMQMRNKMRLLHKFGQSVYQACLRFPQAHQHPVARYTERYQLIRFAD